jgi:hypothetical protein
MRFGKKPDEAKKAANRRIRTGAEPRTLEGRARKKLQMGQKAGFGCVLARAEMEIIIKLLPEGWLDQECL